MAIPTNKTSPTLPIQLLESILSVARRKIALLGDHSNINFCLTAVRVPRTRHVTCEVDSKRQLLTQFQDCNSRSQPAAETPTVCCQSSEAESSNSPPDEKLNLSPADDSLAEQTEDGDPDTVSRSRHSDRHAVLTKYSGENIVESTLVEKIKAPPRTGPYVCNQCDYYYQSYEDLLEHKMEQACLWACDVCNKTFRFKKKLKRHMLFHSVKRRQSCRQVNKKFQPFSDAKNQLDHKCRRKGLPYTEKSRQNIKSRIKQWVARYNLSRKLQRDAVKRCPQTKVNTTAVKRRSDGKKKTGKIRRRMDTHNMNYHMSRCSRTTS